MAEGILLTSPNSQLGLYYDPHFSDGTIEGLKVTALIAQGQEGADLESEWKNAIRPPLLQSWV